MRGNPGPPVLVVPTRGLVLLVGAAGSGKSTFARRHFAATEILSSDAFRALISDDEADQTTTGPAFDILSRVLALRLRRGRLSVVDATNATPGDRSTLLRLAAAARRPAVAIVLDLPVEVALARNALRDGRVVDEQVIRRHAAAVRRTLAQPERLLAEGFATVHVLDDPAAIDAASVVRDPALRPVLLSAVPLRPVRCAPRGRRI